MKTGIRLGVVTNCLQIFFLFLAINQFGTFQVFARSEALEQPTVQEIFRMRVFEEPLVPVGRQPPATENAELMTALRKYSARTNADDFSSLTSFLKNHPDSSWRASLLMNLGLEYYNNAHYSLALDAWTEAWTLSKDAADPKGKAVGDRVAGELAYMNARLGRMNELSALLNSVEGRVFVGQATERIGGSREALWNMQNRPEISFRCGPLALQSIRRSADPKAALPMEILNSVSTQKGMSLPQVQELSTKIGLNYQMAFRESKGAFVVPSVVHWKVGHYAALVKQEDDKFLLEDPTFGNTVWATRATLESETSGYCLIPPGRLQAGWRSVETKEGESIWGKGQIASFDDKRHGCNDPHSNGSDSCNPNSDCQGMAVASVHFMLVNLNLKDEPVGYSPPLGPPVKFIVRYNHREAYQPGTFTYANFGSKWTSDWISYITDNPQSPSADVNYYMRGGGTRTFTGFNTTNQTYAYEQYDQKLLHRTGPASYELTAGDGSKFVFAQSDGSSGTSRKVFLTQVFDAFGNADTLTYDGSLRLTAITDAIGQVTTLTYGNTNDIYKITRVTDPFGRFATFDYDSLGRLTNITDVIGLHSQFTYESTGDFINSLITPYGTNVFTRGGTGTTRWLETLYPDGSRDRVEFNQTTNLGIPFSDPAATVPQGMNTINQFLWFRNTYYWSRNACAQGYGDYTKAKIYHWLHTVDQSSAAGILESTKEPLENRVWYDYAGQSSSIIIGSTSRPAHIGRVLDDGSTQLYTLAYDGFGHVTNAVDPVGRTFSRVYSSDGLDLLEVRQTRGTNNELLAKITYNSQHLPLTVTDAAGQTTTNTYNARGLLLTTANPKGETTTYGYDTNGYLLTVDGPLPGTNDIRRATYDSAGRLMTATDVDGYSVNFEYDSLDRLTKITMPDSTYQQITYDRLNAGVLRDRAGRQTFMEYTPLGQLAKRTDAQGRMTRSEWCDCGGMKSVTDPMGRTTEWEMDVQGRLISKQYGDGSKVSYFYENSTSRLRQIVDEKLQIKQLEYNRDNTVRSVRYPNAARPTAPVSYTYDSDYRRIVSMTDGLGTSQYSYQPVTIAPALGAGRLASIDGPYANDTISYGYDELGRVVSTAINGVPQTVSYDSTGRLTSESNALGSFSYTYDGSSPRRLTETYSNGETVTNTYADILHDEKLVGIANRFGSSNISQFLYTRDIPANRITSWSQQAGAAAADIYSFGYDASDRLLSVAVTNSAIQINTFSYNYDADDNRLVETVGVTTNVATFNALNQLSTATTPNASRTNEWDAEDRLVAVNTGNQRTEFTYDGESRLASIRLLTNGVQASLRRFVWCGQTICEERDASGGSVTRRFFEHGVRIETGTNTGNYFYTRDHLGSVRELIDTSGTVRARYSYDPCGRRTKTTGDLDADFGFAGMLWSAESALALTWWRAYDPQTGRWLSRDPLENAEVKEGPNLYAYVRDNPVNLTDPSGLDSGREQAEKGLGECEDAMADWYEKWLKSKEACQAAVTQSWAICRKAERGNVQSFLSKCQAALNAANGKCKPLSDATEAAWRRLGNCAVKECKGDSGTACVHGVYDILSEIGDDEFGAQSSGYVTIGYKAGYDPKTKKARCYIKAN